MRFVVFKCLMRMRNLTFPRTFAVATMLVLAGSSFGNAEVDIRRDAIVEAVALHHTPAWLGDGNSFNATTAVHAANVFAQEEHPVAEGLQASAVDKNYLQSGGFFDHVDSWRDTCKSRG